MQPPLTKRFAGRVMALALFLSPPPSRDWAAGMAAELDYVDGSFKTMAWSMGCLGIALKQFCVAILCAHAMAVETEDTVSKFAKISAVGLVVGSCLFLFAPTFQQGVKLTAAAWNQSDSSCVAKMSALGHKAEAAHDAQTLAALALQMRYRSREAQTERDKFADEAVEWDPNLTWVYSYMLTDSGAAPDHRDPNDMRWLARLEAWAPENAAVDALEASYDQPHGVRGLDAQADRALLAGSPGWLSAMSKAFSATDYDSYLSQARTLERDVLRRDGLIDPGNVLWLRFGFGIVNAYDFDLYAKDFLLPAGAGFEAGRDFQHAEDNYRKAARLSALIALHGTTAGETLAASNLQLAVDPKLEALYERNGNSAAAQFVAYQLASAEHAKSRLLAAARQRNWNSSVQIFDAYVLQASLLAMIVSLLMIASCGAYFGVRRLRSRKAPRRTTAFSRIGGFGAGLLFVSAITMYFGFAPYAEAVQRFLASANPADPPEYLLRFWGLHAVPTVVLGWFFSPVSGMAVDFWYGVIAAGMGIVAWILYRYLARRLHRATPMSPAV